MLKLTAAAALAALGTACNTAEELAVDMLPGGSQSHNTERFAGGLERPMDLSTPLTLLPQDKGDESPACLDGSPYGFYFQKSKTGSTKWTISIEGGGWCYDEQVMIDTSSAPPLSSRWAPVHTTHTLISSDTHPSP